LKEDPEKLLEDQTSCANGVNPSATGLPQGELQGFVAKWGARFAAQLKPPVPKPSLPDRQPAKTFLFSTRIVKWLNYLNQPLFWMGVVFLGWLLVELVLPKGYRAALVKFQPLITISGAIAIGYWTNWCAVKMIFYPQAKNAVWWGLIPARRQELTELITESMVTKLVSPEIVQAYLAKDDLLHNFMVRCTATLGSFTKVSEFRSEFKKIVAQYLQQLLQEPQTVERITDLIQSRIAEMGGDSLKEKVFAWTKPLWGPLVQTEISRTLNNSALLTEQLLGSVDVWLDELPGTLERQAIHYEALIVKLIAAGLENLNLKAIISAQLAQMDESQFEKILAGNLNPELVFIQVSGGLLGGLVGIALFYRWFRVVLLLLGIVLWVIYRVTRGKDR
jgi:uncharacterized membrane protein YheB (UPF0754 family)